MEKEVVINMNGETEEEKEEKSPEREPEDEVDELEDVKAKLPVYIIYVKRMPNAPVWEPFQLFSDNYDIAGCVVGGEPCNHIWSVVEQYKNKLQNELKDENNLSINVIEYKLPTGGSGGWDINFHYTYHGFFGHPYCEYGTAYRISFIQTNQLEEDRP
jgi:hypothetical protein